MRVFAIHPLVFFESWGNQACEIRDAAFHQTGTLVNDRYFLALHCHQTGAQYKLVLDKFSEFYFLNFNPDGRIPCLQQQRGFGTPIAGLSQFDSFVRFCLNG